MNFLVHAFQRFFGAAISFFGVITLTFFVMNIAPGDPVLSAVGERYNEETLEQFRKELHLDKPVLVQYGHYLKKMLRGDLGKSFVPPHHSVSAKIRQKFPYTLKLAFAALLVSVLLGLTIGTISGLFRGKWIDRFGMFFALSGISAPVFWVGLVLIWLVSVKLGFLPPSGSSSWKHLILPAVTLGLRSAAFLARITRSHLIDEFGKDYLRTARAKGLSETIVVMKHAFKNVLIPTVTIIGTDFGSFLSGAVLTESIFSWPGIGRMAMDAIQKRDFPEIQGVVIFTACVFIVINLIVDLLYGLLDPRVRRSEEI